MSENVSFGRWLRQRRRRLDLTQEGLATRVGYAVPTIRRVEADDLRPSRELAEKLADALALASSERPAFVRFARGDREAMSLLPPPDVVAPGRFSPSPEPPAAGPPPFKGLAYFDEADAPLFYGREALTERLTHRMSESRFLAVVGASGSGKSSLVRAGVLPALLQAAPDWRIHLITPTAHPLEALAVSLTRASSSPTATAHLLDELSRDLRSLHLFASATLNPAARLLLVVDQFEELFALCADERERVAFVDNLMTATAPRVNDRVRVLLTLRADFYAHCAQYPALRSAIAHSQEYIGPLDESELRRAIEGPAAKTGWALEPGLVELILRDVGREPGALPLLSHALLEIWQRRRGRTLTLEGYAEAGGVQGAIARTADTVYDEQTPEAQAVTRRIFLRLTEPGEGQPDTRRLASRAELVTTAVEGVVVERVLERLAETRLITLGPGTVEVAHEALIREWPRLRQWLDASRANLRVQRQLGSAAAEWAGAGEDASFLASGTRLAQFEALAADSDLTLTRDEMGYLAASVAERDRQASVERERQARQLEAEKRRAEEQAQAARRLRQRAVYLTGALVVAGVLALAALFFGQQATARQAEAEAQRRTGFVRELSVNAVANLTIDPERSILLALEAVSVSSTGGKPVLREAEEALHRAVQTSRVKLTLRGHTNSLDGAAFSPDGTRVATRSLDGTARVWDAETGRQLLTLHTGVTSSPSSAFVGTIAFSPEGTRILTTGTANTATIWDATTGGVLLKLSGHTQGVQGVAFSPDGNRVATASVDRTAKVWDAMTGQTLLTLVGHSDAVTYIAFSADGSRLVTASQDMTAKVWNATTGTHLFTLKGHTGIVRNAVFSPDGKRLATIGFSDGTVKVWDSFSGQLLLTLFRRSVSGNSVAYNWSGTRLAMGSGDGIATLWDAETGQLLLELHGHTSAINQLALYSGTGGDSLITAADDGTARLWDVSPTGGREWVTLAGHADRVRDIAYSADGARLVTASADKTARVWDAATGQELLSLVGHAGEVRAATFSPDGRRVATTSDDQTSKVWDIATGQVLLTLPTEAPVPSSTNHSVAFSPDGKHLAVESQGTTAKIYNAMTGQEELTLIGHTALIRSIAFSPDGERIATASADRTVKVWDATSERQVLSLAGHSGPLFAVAFSRDGKRLATGSTDGTAKVWDGVIGQEILTLARHSGIVLNVAFNLDGTQLATSSTDATVKVWNLAVTDGRIEEPLTLYGHSGEISTVVFSPDGRRLATASRDGTSRIYALPSEDIVGIAKTRVTRDLTCQERRTYLHEEVSCE